MKSIKNIREFAEANNISRQLVEYRIKQGWKIGVLDGSKVMYNPKHIQEIKDSN
jgi:DNA-binding Lrp family transcriptional regulator